MNTRRMDITPGQTDVRVEAGSQCVAFDFRETGSSELSVTVASGATFRFRGLYLPGTSGKITVTLEGADAKSDVRSVAISSGVGATAFECRTYCRANGCESYAKSCAFALPGADLRAVTVADIGSGICGVRADALQSNVFFGDSGKIRGIPELRVGSDDVKARHSCTVERFSEEKLFYLRSRGITEADAAASLVSGSVSEAFSGLSEAFVADSEFFCRNALKSIAG